MSEARYKVVFNGVLVPGADPDTTRDNLAALFKSERSKIDALFTGSSVALKRDLSDAEAQKYVDVLQRAGIQVRAEAELASTLSLVETEEHDAKPVTERMTCPKCGHEQPKAIECEACGVVVEKFLARQAQMAEAPQPASVSPYSAPQSQVTDGYADVGELRLVGVSGRIGRMRYLAWTLVLTLIAIVPGVLAGILITNGSVGLGITLAVVLTISLLVWIVFFMGQRLHDIGWSAWLILLVFVPIVSMVFTVLLIAMPGTPGPNRYGAAPPENSLPVLILGGINLFLTVLGMLFGILGALAGLI